MIAMKNEELSTTEAQERRYNFIYKRVKYPAERGFRMEPVKLPDWIFLTIDDFEDSKRLTVHSRIHVNREVVMNPIYSTAFSDFEIIRDMSQKITDRFL